MSSTISAPKPIPSALERRRDAFDVVLLQQGAFSRDQLEGLIRKGLLLPAVVVGDVSGRIDYHEVEVHLPGDQLEQLTYSIDAAVSRFLRRGLAPAGSSAEAGDGQAGPQAGAPVPSERWRLPNRLQERLGYLGSSTSAIPPASCGTCPSWSARSCSPPWSAPTATC
jgi:circadian clock protein KaiA